MRSASLSPKHKHTRASTPSPQPPIACSRQRGARACTWLLLPIAGGSAPNSEEGGAQYKYLFFSFLVRGKCGTNGRLFIIRGMEGIKNNNQGKGKEIFLLIIFFLIIYLTLFFLDESLSTFYFPSTLSLPYLSRKDYPIGYRTPPPLKVGMVTGARAPLP